jgi:hypothetical protein
LYDKILSQKFCILQKNATTIIIIIIIINEYRAADSAIDWLTANA